MQKIFLLMLLAAIALTTACKSKKETPVAKNEVDTEIIAVRTVAVMQRNVAHDIVTTGTVASKSEAKLSFKTGGIISKIYVKEGDVIKAGQLLATLDLTEINSQVAQARLGLEKSARDLQRAKNLYADTVATLEQVQNATTGNELAQRNVEIATFNQRFSEIRAVKSGRIVKKLMSEGELAGPGMPVFFINEADNNDWVVRAQVSDRDWAALQIGNTAQIQLDAYKDLIFNAKVSKLAEFADPYSGTYEVELSLSPQASKRFASGMFGHIAVKTARPSVMSVIPIEALVEGNGSEGFVYTLTNDQTKVKKVAVKIAQINNSDIGIASGLEGITSVVTAGAAFLTEDSKVKLVEK